MTTSTPLGKAGTTTPLAARSVVVMNSMLITKYDRPGPRYTSYPTADRFVEGYGSEQHLHTLENRGVTSPDRPLSLYVHLPFCNTICYYCGCNKVVTKDHSRSATYLGYVEREVALVSKHLTGSRRVDQLHLGGGTPTFLSADELRALMAMLTRHFEMDADGTNREFSIEIDPRTVDRNKIETLAKLGFNRMSVGVQDFDDAVQRAVNRIQSEAETTDAITTARANGFTSINIDLIYGLPKQNVIGFKRTLDRVIAMKPDRIALYSYAHLPTLFKPQRRIADADLPTAEVRLQILALAIEKLGDAGYVYIGMDHFALPHDELALAAKESALHRNFQGYSTRPDCDLLALGVSAISNIGATYTQNVKTLDDYYAMLDRGELPVFRGVELDDDDLLRRDVIQTLMCDFELSLSDFEAAYAVRFQDYFVDEWPLLQQFEREELIEIEDDRIRFTPCGRLLVRVVAMIFDRYLKVGMVRERYSKVI
jgi:oxygen-independent coproporphyrinogen III oxidase